jgi:hypothetical protein
VGNAEVDQVIETFSRRLKRPSRRERADVQLIEHGGRYRLRLPAHVSPREGAVIEDPRGAVHPMWLPQ